MKFIELTLLKSGESIVISRRHIISLHPAEDGCIIYLDGGAIEYEIRVVESFRYVIDLIQ